MTRIKIKLIVFAFIVFTQTACKNVQSKLDQVSSKIEYTEKNKKEMTSDDWASLELQMKELERDYELNKDKYSEEQIKEIGKLQGRYSALLLKKGLNDFQESVKDLGNQVEGFIEGITDTTTN
jgi:hypothetical protein